MQYSVYNSFLDVALSGLILTVPVGRGSQPLCALKLGCGPLDFEFFCQSRTGGWFRISCKSKYTVNWPMCYHLANSKCCWTTLTVITVLGVSCHSGYMFNRIPKSKHNQYKTTPKTIVLLYSSIRTLHGKWVHGRVSSWCNVALVKRAGRVSEHRAWWTWP